MVEQQKRRIENEMTRMVEDIDKQYLRKMQGDMHRCAAKCCDNENLSVQRVHGCIENCSEALSKAQQYVQGEFERTQNRLQRCVMECNDRIRDKVGPATTQAEVDKYTEEFEQCATKCVDHYCDLLPSLERSMKKVLESKSFDILQ